MDANTIAIAAVGAVVIAERLGLLERLHIVKRSAADAESELKLADRTVLRLQGELATAAGKAAELEKTRSLTPVMDAVSAVARIVESVAASQVRTAELQEAVLTRLDSLNGGMAHTRDSLQKADEGLRASTEAIKFLAGQIVAAEVPRTRRTA